MNSPPRDNATTPARSRAIAFLTGLLRNPGMVGTIVPSSRFLEQRLAARADIHRARIVVELGPGIGGTTLALLRALPAEARLLAIEREAAYVEVVRAIADPRLIVHHGSAADLVEILKEHNLPAPDAVVSGIPFSAIPPSIGWAIVEAIWAGLAPGGRFVAYQFRDNVERIGREVIGPAEVEIEYLNAPPLRVFRWMKPNPQSDTKSTVSQPSADAHPEVNAHERTP